MKKLMKIGGNRGKARIWIEGQALSAMNWNKGDEFSCSFGEDVIIYSRVTGHPFGKPRKVAGTETRPIIDTNTDKILETLGEDATHVHVEIESNRIVITKAPTPEGFVKKAAKVLALAVGIAAPYLTQFAPDAKRILVACEESGKVRDQLTDLGHDAVSCDLLPSRSPRGWHIQGEVEPYLDQDWDEIYAFPPCTYLTVSAAYLFKDPDFERYPEVGYHQRIGPDKLRGADRRQARAEAIAFVDKIWGAADTVVIENPKGFLSTMWKKPTQMIHPHWFGDAESKETCLWIKGADPVVATERLNIEEHGYQVLSGAHAGKWRWNNQSPCGGPRMGPSSDRAKKKSVTYDGIAHALATQISGQA